MVAALACAALAVWSIAGPGSSAAWAQGPDAATADEMRREIRQLRAQVEALRSALAESADLERERLAVLTRALRSASASGAEPAWGAPAAPTLPSRNEAAAETGSARGATARAGAPAPRTMARPAGAPPPAVARRHPVEEPRGVVRGHVDIPAGEPVAYVYVENVFEPAVKNRKVVIEQRGKSFTPSWAVVQRGTVIEFPNLDNIYHNVFSLSSGNSFDLGLYNSAGEAKAHAFNEPGAVDIYCNIHPQMAASTLVVPNRYFAKVKPDGNFEIAGVPYGKRKVVAWSPGSRLTSQWIELDSDTPAELSLKLESKAAGHSNKAGRAYGSYE
jgi:plastocyanin